MASLYSSDHRALQEAFGSRKLADFLDEHHVHAALAEDEAAFVGSRDMFFLSTVDPNGRPTVSYKGGAPGFVRILDAETLVFPGFDGNGMFYSMGNIAGQGHVGMLFIDFETPHRLRLQGQARVERDDPLRKDFPEAQYLVRVAIEQVWVNCPRYIHKYRKVARSAYVPTPGAETPMPGWKRLDILQDVLPAPEQERARAEGLLDVERYQAKVMRGEA